MIDRRELVLAQSAAVIKTVPGIVLADRNRINVTAARRPAIIQDDGTEEIAPGDDVGQGGSRNSGVQRMVCTVGFRILLGDTADNIGPHSNGLRSALLSALFSDATLLDLLGVANSRSTRIQYTGGGLDLGEGEQREATMTVNVAMTYVFRIGDILPD